MRHRLLQYSRGIIELEVYGWYRMLPRAAHMTVQAQAGRQQGER